MTTVTERKSALWDRCGRRNILSGGIAEGGKPLSWLKGRPFDLPYRLSVGFGLGPAPSQTQPKSRSQSADGSGRQFVAAPPGWKLFMFGLGQKAQGPQKPEKKTERGCNQFNLDLCASFSFGAMELTTGQSQIAFHQSNAVFNAKALFINRLGLARRGQFDFKRYRHEDQQLIGPTFGPIQPISSGSVQLLAPTRSESKAATSRGLDASPMRYADNPTRLSRSWVEDNRWHPEPGRAIGPSLD
jgi:hypothetical protein